MHAKMKWTKTSLNRFWERMHTRLSERTWNSRAIDYEDDARTFSKTHNLCSQEQYANLALSLPAAQANETNPAALPRKHTCTRQVDKHTNIYDSNHYKDIITKHSAQRGRETAFQKTRLHFNSNIMPTTRCCEKCPNTQCGRETAFKKTRLHFNSKTMPTTRCCERCPNTQCLRRTYDTTHYDTMPTTHLRYNATMLLEMLAMHMILLVVL